MSNMTTELTPELAAKYWAHVIIERLEDLERMKKAVCNNELRHNRANTQGRETVERMTAALDKLLCSVDVSLLSKMEPNLAIFVLWRRSMLARKENERAFEERWRMNDAMREEACKAR